VRRWFGLDHASAARLTVLLCFAHCCRAVGTATANSYCLGSFRKEECCPMRAHLDKKPSDGAAIGFFVITLLSPFALAILLSRLNAFFWSWCRGGRRTANPWHTVWNGGQLKPIVVEEGFLRKGGPLDASLYG
jgi:hypothetical protein